MTDISTSGAENLKLESWLLNNANLGCFTINFLHFFKQSNISDFLCCLFIEAMCVCVCAYTFVCLCHIDTQISQCVSTNIDYQILLAATDLNNPWLNSPKAGPKLDEDTAVLDYCFIGVAGQVPGMTSCTAGGRGAGGLQSPPHR